MTTGLKIRLYLAVLVLPVRLPIAPENSEKSRLRYDVAMRKNCDDSAWNYCWSWLLSDPKPLNFINLK